MQWSEKWRPTKIEDIVGQNVIKATVKKFINDGGIPNCLFHSETPGTGKTSMAYAIAHEILGDDFDTNFAYFDASVDRNIEFLRKNVVRAAKHQPINGRIRIILLDEADLLLKDSFQLLRGTLDPVGRETKTKIIFTANNFEAFTTPITSRLQVFKFEPLSKDDVIKRLKQIAEAEEVKVTDRLLKEIAKETTGDLRSAINLLQQKVYAEEAEEEELAKLYKKK